MSHSPGPWKLSERPLRNAWAVVDAEDREVATAFMRETGPGLADAALIAAAPRMLELLRKHEFSGSALDAPACPECLNRPMVASEQGHQPDCALGQLLAELEKAGV